MTGDDKLRIERTEPLLPLDMQQDKDWIADEGGGKGDEERKALIDAHKKRRVIAKEAADFRHALEEAEHDAADRAQDAPDENPDRG